MPIALGRAARLDSGTSTGAGTGNVNQLTADAQLRIPERYTAQGMKQLLLALIDGYKLLLSPFFGSQCRFYPTCSSYAREAIDVHGTLCGSWLAVKRIVKCHPWHPGGVDLVPPRHEH
jgi:putative membrane protein insertion efficiency factor